MSEQVAASSEREILLQALAATDMPVDALRNWFAHNEAFCNRHGGQRLYREWLELYAQCRAAMES